MRFQDMKYIIDERIADVKLDMTYMELTWREAMNVVLRLIDLFDFPDNEREIARHYVKEHFSEENRV